MAKSLVGFYCVVSTLLLNKLLKETCQAGAQQYSNNCVLNKKGKICFEDTAYLNDYFGLDSLAFHCQLHAHFNRLQNTKSAKEEKKTTKP